MSTVPRPGSIDSADIQKRVEATVLQHGPTWIMNARKNAPFVKQDITKLPMRTAREAVLVNSGSSLNEQIEYIVRNRPNLDLFCSPTNYSYLRAVGLTPDFLVSIDGSPVQGQVIGEPSVPPEVILLACPFTTYNLVWRAQGQVYWFRNHLQGTPQDSMADSFGLNRFMQWMFPDLNTSIIQAGNVGNNMLLLAHMLVREGIALYERVVLAGWDYRDGRVARYKRFGNEWQPLQVEHVEPSNAAYFDVHDIDGIPYHTHELNIQYINSALFLWAEALRLFPIYHVSGPSLLPMPTLADSGKPYPTVAEIKERVALWRKLINEEATDEEDA